MRLLTIAVAALGFFFPIFWIITWLTGSNQIGGWAALGLALVAGPVLALRSWRQERRCPDGKGLYPECLFVVSVSDEEISNRRPDGVIERVAVKDLREVAIETNTSGPWGADVWWLLTGAADARCAFPGGATGEGALLEWLQKLPGFDDQAVIDAMGCTTNAHFLCWRRHDEVEELKTHA